MKQEWLALALIYWMRIITSQRARAGANIPSFGLGSEVDGDRCLCEAINGFNVRLL